MDFNWRGLLELLSRELLKINNYGLPIDMSLPQEAIDSQWLGYPGATEEAIAAAETRLGKRLPPSYKAFLKVSNGWHQTSPLIWRLFPVEEIDWYHNRYQDVINAYAAALANNPALSDEDYLVYGENQREWQFRAEYLQTALQVSEDSDSGVYLLNPNIVTQDEWEAWFLSSDFGAVRYRSFYELMQSEYKMVAQLEK